MKKVFCLLVTVAVLLTFLLQPVRGSIAPNVENIDTVIEIEDSLSISEEVRNKLNASKEDFVVRFYTISLFDEFIKANSIQEVLCCGEVLQEAYIVEMPDGSMRFVDPRGYIEFLPKYTIINGQEVERPAITILEDAWNAFKTRTVVEMIAPDVTVNHIYYIYAESMMEGTAVYYETDRGDYIYYNHYKIGECLFPIEDFCQYMQDLYEARKQQAYASGGAELAGIWDLSSYDIHSDTFDLNVHYNKGEGNGIASETPSHWETVWPILVVVGGSAFGVVILIMYKKIKSEHAKYR